MWPRLPVPSFLTPLPQTCPRPPFHQPLRRISTSSVPPQTRPASHILVYFPVENSRWAFAWRIVSWYLIKLGRHAVCWWVRIGLVQEGLDRGEDGRHVVCGGPAVLEDVQTNAPVSVHIRVEHFTHKPEKENVRNKVKTQSRPGNYLTVGGLLGYSSVNSIVNLKVPSSKGVSWGPNITAFHSIMLLSLGAPDTPAKQES